MVNDQYYKTETRPTCLNGEFRYADYIENVNVINEFSITAEHTIISVEKQREFLFSTIYT